MFRNGGSVRDLTVCSDENEGLDVGAVGRCVDADRCSCILALCRVMSLLLSVFFVARALRSSVIFDDVTSLL